MGSHNPNFGASRLFLQSLANIESSRMRAGTLPGTLSGGLEYYERHSHAYRGGAQFHKESCHGPNPQRAAWEWETDPTMNHLSNHRINEQSRRCHTTVVVRDLVPTVPIKFRALDGADVGPDPMEVDPTTLSVLHTTTLSSSNEGGLPFWNYKRRRGTDKSSTEVVVGGDPTKKKRRLIRPSLELEDQVPVVFKGSIPIGKSVRARDNRVSDSVVKEMKGEVPRVNAIFSDCQTDQSLVPDKRPVPLVGGDVVKKRRRLIRPSLELEDQVSMVSKGSIPDGKSIRDHDNQVSDSAIFSDYRTDHSSVVEDERPGPVLDPDEIIDQIIAELIDAFTDEKMDEIFNNSTFEAEKGPLLMSQNPFCRYHPSYPLDSVFPRRTMELWHDIKF